METEREREPIYGHTYHSTRSMIFVWSGVTAPPELEDMATELRVDYEISRVGDSWTTAIARAAAWKSDRDKVLPPTYSR